MEYITNKDFYNDIISYGGPSSDFVSNIHFTLTYMFYKKLTVITVCCK